ncbi:hypothetical protein LINPERPRIM_LOCUS30204 [Linum perenne]
MVTTRNTSSNANDVPEGPDHATLALQVRELQEQLAALQSSSHRGSGHHNGGRRNSRTGDEEDSDGSARFSRKTFHNIGFPRYDGSDDPRNWILKAEKYFHYHKTPDDEKVDVAFMYLENDALSLFSWINSEQPIFYWEELTKLLQQHFGPAEFVNPDEYLAGIKQTGSIKEYRQEFARRSARVRDWSDNALLGVFLQGLKEELKADVRLHKPTSVYRAMSIALEVEGKVRFQRTSHPSTDSLPAHTASHSIPHANVNSAANVHSSANFSPNINAAATVKSAHVYSSAPSHINSTSQLSSESVKQARRDKGLCFRCGDKFTPGHRCNSATFSMMQGSAAYHHPWDLNSDEDDHVTPALTTTANSAEGGRRSRVLEMQEIKVFETDEALKTPASA